MKRNRQRAPIRNPGFWIVILILAGAATGIYFWKPWAAAEVPISETAEVLFGDYIDYVELRGESRNNEKSNWKMSITNPT